jgi:hypothetical protein
MKSVMDASPVEVSALPQDAAAPSEDVIRAKWPELAKQYTDKPRLSSMLSSSTLIVEGTDESRTVTFRVMNDAQKEWVESKLLHELEGGLRNILGSVKVYLRVAVIPDDTKVEKKAYMPGEQVTALMAGNVEVKNLVTDLQLDIK